MLWVWKPNSGRWHMLNALLNCCHGAQFCILDAMRTLGVKRPPWPWRSKGDLGVVLNFSFISCTILSLHLFLPIQLVRGVHHGIHNVLGDYKTAANTHRKLFYSILQVSQPVSSALALAVSLMFILSVTAPCLFFPRTLMVLKSEKKLSESKYVLYSPLFIQKPLKPFSKAWYLLLFTVLFKIG